MNTFTPTLTPVPTGLRALQIGGICVEPPLALAPMAGYTDQAFRQLARSLGGVGLVYTEVISSNGLYHENKKTYVRFTWAQDEYPVCVQLYGSKPEIMAHATAEVVARGAHIVDINMGCPVHKLTKNGSGAALMRDPDHAAAIIEAVIGASSVPVTVKLRAGWDDDTLTAVEIAQAAESLGAAAVAVHGRTAVQKYTGTADWAAIGAVKQAVTRIPVIGNGDVKSAADARRMVRQTGCDGVMIGRGALGQPWLFAQIARELATGEPQPEPTRSERAAVALQHARAAFALAHKSVPERIVALNLRKHLAKYRLDLPGSADIRRALVRTSSLAEIEAILVPLTQTG